MSSVIEFTPDGRGPYQLQVTSDHISGYKGPYTNWRKMKDAEVHLSDYLSCLVDMTLYATDSHLKYLHNDLQATQFSPETFVSERLSGLDIVGVESTARNIVDFVWKNNKHHWGRLLTEELSDREFVTDYLFRFIYKLKDVDNSFDNSGSRTVKDYMFALENFELDDGTAFDEFIVEQGFDNSFYQVHRGLSGSILEEAKEECVKNIMECIGILRDNQDDFNSWWSPPPEKSILEFARYMGSHAVYGNFNDYLLNVAPNPIYSLAEYVLTEYNHELEPLYSIFMSRAEAK